MTIGSLLCAPNCSFRVMRPALGTVSISGILGMPVVTGNVWYFPHPVLPNEDYYLIWQDGFLPWSSGAWQLKDIVAEYYHVFAGDPTHYPVDFQLYYTKPTAAVPADILNVPFGVSTTPNRFFLDPPDAPYWWNGTDF